MYQHQGEHEHRRVKARRARTNGRDTEGQMAEIEVREGRLRRMADELRACGVTVPEFNGKGKDTSIPAGPLTHHWIAQESSGRIALDLSHWQYSHPNDPAIQVSITISTSISNCVYVPAEYPSHRQRFTYRFRAHLWQRVTSDTGAINSNSVLIKNNCIYRHATLQVNFTTYDVRRDVDTIHPQALRDDGLGFSLDKTGILVHTAASTTAHPWLYAVVLGVFHAHVLFGESEARIDFIWVRWLDRDWSWTAGPTTRKLERLTLAPLGEHDGTDFIDPATIIRGCHLIPAFHHGLSPAAGPSSVADDASGNWRYYYVGRYVLRFTCLWVASH